MFGVILTSRPTMQVAETIDHIDCIPTRKEAQRISDEWCKEGNRTATIYEMIK